MELLEQEYSNFSFIQGPTWSTSEALMTPLSFIGAALSLSSSAFLLQSCRESELPTGLGSATLGILLRNQCNKYKCSFYEGVIDCYFTRKKRHQVIYADGDLEELKLIEERWELLKDDTSGDADVYLPECLPLSDILQSQKVEKSKNSCHVCGTCYFLRCKILQ